MNESRLFKVLYYLLDKGSATAPELAARFEVSVRTIYRDIDALSSAGVPVYAETGRNGGIHLLSDLNEKIKEFLIAGMDKGDLRTNLKIMPTIFNFWGMLSGLIQFVANKEEYIKKQWDYQKPSF